MNDSLAKIRFLDYKVKKINFTLNSNYEDVEKKPQPVELDFQTQYNINQEKKIFQLIFECCVNKTDFEETDKFFSLDLIVCAKFAYDGVSNADELKNLMKINAVSILFPYIRSIISIITLNCGVQSLVIPTYNINKLVQFNEDSFNFNENSRL